MPIMLFGERFEIRQFRTLIPGLLVEDENAWAVLLALPEHLLGYLQFMQRVLAQFGMEQE